jgi:small conductance mechanosensitive channel
VLLVDKIYHYAILALGLVMALDQLGVNVAAALAGLGVAGIAVGFAAQDTLSNMISGITIFLDKPFKVGDWITTTDVYGQVSEITLRTTRIRTKRNTWIVIPNRAIIDSTLENHSKRGEMRVDVPVGIAYKEDIDEARGVLLEAVRGIPGQAAGKNPEVAVVALGNSSVDLHVRIWIEDPGDLRPSEAAVVEASKKALDAAGIEIPFPHLQLFVDEVRPLAIENLGQLRALSSGEGHPE